MVLLLPQTENIILFCLAVTFAQMTVVVLQFGDLNAVSPGNLDKGKN